MNILGDREARHSEGMNLGRCHPDKVLDMSPTFLFVCPSSRKSSWQLRQKRTSLPIWVSSTLSLGREMRRPSLLPGWMISCVYISVYPICLPFCGFKTAFDPCSVLCFFSLSASQAGFVIHNFAFFVFK